MKKILSVIAFLGVFYPLSAQQCAIDTVPLAHGTPSIDTAIMEMDGLPCLSPSCTQVESATSWNLRPNATDTIAGDLMLFSQDSGLYRVTILRECRYVLFDTCGYLLRNEGTADHVFRIAKNFGANAQLVICGDFGDSVQCQMKEFPLTDTLKIKIDLDTLCGALGVPEMVQSRYTYQALDLLRGTKGEPQDTPPVGLSVRSDGVKIWRE